MYADLSLDHRILKGHCRKKALKPCERKELAQAVVEEEGLSISRACSLVSFEPFDVVLPNHKRRFRSNGQAYRDERDQAQPWFRLLLLQNPHTRLYMEQKTRAKNL